MKNTKNTLVVNPLTLLVVIFYLFSGYKKDLVSLLLVFLIHELGHIFFISLFRLKILKIEIYPFGGIIKIYNKLNYSVIKNILISSGGIIFQLILEIINIYLIKNNKIHFYNHLLLLINLLPISPLDGNKIVMYALMYVIPYVYSIIFSRVISIIALVIYLFISHYYRSLNIMLTTIMIINIYRDIKSIKGYKKKFLLERYLNDFSYLKIKKYKKINLNLIHLNRYTIFGTKNMQSEREILGKMFDKQAYFWYYLIRLKGFPGKTALKRFWLKHICVP